MTDLVNRTDFSQMTDAELNEALDLHLQVSVLTFIQWGTKYHPPGELYREMKSRPVCKKYLDEVMDSLRND